jgi:hypothetical protein
MISGRPEVILMDCNIDTGTDHKAEVLQHDDNDDDDGDISYQVL